MRKLVLSTVAVAALLMSGCSKKTPEVDMANSGLDGLAQSIQNQVQNVYFDFDKFNIRPDMVSVVSSNAALFNQAGAEAINITVEGNCDEWGSDEYNHALGLKRANVVRDALINEGVSASRLSVVSYGENNLVCSDRTKACDALNRRDEFKVSY